MFEYIKGQIAEITPTNAVVDCGGLGFNILISLQTYDKLKSESEGKLFIYHHLREDDEQLYGFATKDERELFKLLISVNSILDANKLCIVVANESLGPSATFFIIGVGTGSFECADFFTTFIVPPSK